MMTLHSSVTTDVAIDMGNALLLPANAITTILMTIPITEVGYLQEPLWGLS